jgi:hypothetical protein
VLSNISLFFTFSQFFSLQEFARYILYVCLISILKPCREEVKRWGMELKAKGVLVHGNIDNRCLRVEHHQDSHANARPVMLRVKSFFVSVHLPKFFGSENLDDAASAINDYTTQKDLAKKKKKKNSL